MARTVLIAAGGTGGHLFPGIAVADELVRRDAATRVVFAGTPKGLESRLVPKAGYALELLGDWSWRVGGVQGVMRDRKTGWLMGGADPRRNGYAMGW